MSNKHTPDGVERNSARVEYICQFCFCMLILVLAFSKASNVTSMEAQERKGINGSFQQGAEQGLFQYAKI